MSLRRLASPVLAALVALVALAAAEPSWARASAVSASELRGLARRAPDDPGALRRLREVDRVDGRKVDVAGALRGARGGELRSRLRALAAPSPPARPRPQASADARQILAQRRFRQSGVPRPFAGILRTLGRVLDPVRRAVVRLVEALDRLLPGGSAVVWSVLAALVLLVAGIVTNRLVRRRGVALERADAGQRRRAGGLEDPGELERTAEEAERDGDLERALRLRFRAGLLRLDARGAIRFRSSLTSGEVARTLRSPAFDEVARGFDAVVYGRRPAREEDVQTSRSGWRDVLEEVPAQ